MKQYQRLFLTSMLSCLNLKAFAASTIIVMHLLSPTGDGKDIGTITAQDTQYGLLLTPNLHGLPPGTHGFHLHDKPSCAEEGMAAGGHFDPASSKAHNGPYQRMGHLGDLPALIVDKDGNATLKGLAPRIKLHGLRKHALMIHAGGDNYADQPEALGGGGKRIACGVIQ